MRRFVWVVALAAFVALAACAESHAQCGRTGYKKVNSSWGTSGTVTFTTAGADSAYLDAAKSLYVYVDPDASGSVYITRFKGPHLVWGTLDQVALEITPGNGALYKDGTMAGFSFTRSSASDAIYYAASECDAIQLLSVTGDATTEAVTETYSIGRIFTQDNLNKILPQAGLGVDLSGATAAALYIDYESRAFDTGAPTTFMHCISRTATDTLFSQYAGLTYSPSQLASQTVLVRNPMGLSTWPAGRIIFPLDPPYFGYYFARITVSGDADTLNWVNLTLEVER